MIDSPEQIAFWQYQSFLSGLARQGAGLAPVVGLGDSLAQTMHGPLGGVCLHNMGLSGARISTVQKYMLPMLPWMGASAGFLLVGTNHVGLAADDPELVNFYVDYTALCQDVRTSISRLVVLSIPPVEPSPGDDFSVSRDRITMLNGAIKNIAMTIGLGYFELNGMMRGPDLYALPGATVDKIHFSAATFASLLPRLSNAMSAAMSCTPGTFWEAQL